MWRMDHLVDTELAAWLHLYKLQAVKLDVKVETSDERQSSWTGIGTTAV